MVLSLVWELESLITHDVIKKTATVAGILNSQLKNQPIDLALNQRICQHVAQNMAYME